MDDCGWSSRWSLLLLVLLGFGAWGFRTANRLDRLHVRYDLSWQALDAALARRAVVARAVAAERVRRLPATPKARNWSRGPTRRKPPHGGPVKRVRTSCRPRWRWSIRLRCLRA